MLFQYKNNLKSYSRKLRHDLTDAERLLWSKIRHKQLRGYQFNRQKPIGDYVIDFYSCRAMLDVEVDGGQHYEENNKKADKKRDLELEKLGIKVLRFSNAEVLKNIEGVIMKIQEELK
ncbi:MAG: hypothetical protein UW11_C0014G0010 [Parcubacteria group bacterium GW2011_GWA2_43_9b]|uniref:DUF559 domain-containing protein n=1 Tax=Candidatus Portnoybacteria bacterium RIFCSPLOWO2_02_FULL_39_11 TaxID=1802001 RepID=A0A1G2FPX3_9BACT|nr:MAG: hypothetical protein UW11_C0014G0010 [Parcubacteria group bacterium GW2011_GWA2_43_9b]OGZ39668.1 MAG: hypothetical protein A3B04_01455 [Candidatus Portnoybacteria bacterium RIFCSPLOWO2_02_FULL_39_11]